MIIVIKPSLLFSNLLIMASVHVILVSFLFYFANAQSPYCPNLPEQVYDNHTGPIFICPVFSTKIVSVEITNEEVRELLKVEISETQNSYELSPEEKFKDYLDDTGNSVISSNLSIPSDGIIVEFEDGSGETCSILIAITDSNNKAPEFSRPGPMEFTISTTYDTSIALNWDYLNNELYVTDKDHEIKNAEVTIESSNKLIRGVATLRKGEEAPAHLHLYDVQLFVDGPIGTGIITSTLTASDGVNENILEVIVNVRASNLNPPVFVDTGYHHEFKTMPVDGDTLSIIKAHDPDDINGVIEFKITSIVDFIEIAADTGVLTINSRVAQYIGQSMEIRITATEVDTTEKYATNINLSLQFPTTTLKFTEPYYAKEFSSYPKENDILVKVELAEPAPDVKFGSTSIPTFISVDENDGSVYFNSEITSETDLGQYGENGVIIFTVVAKSGTVEATTVIMATLPLPIEEASTTQSTTGESSGSTTPCECDGSTTGSTNSDSSSSSGESSSTTESTSQTDPISCPTIPPCECDGSTTDNSGSTTSDSTSSSSTTESTCPTIPPCECECSTLDPSNPPSEASTSATVPSCPPGESCSTSPISEPSSQSTPSSDSTTGAGSCPPCSTDCPPSSNCPECPVTVTTTDTSSVTDCPNPTTNGPPSNETSSTTTTNNPCGTECPPEEECSKTGLIAAVIATSVLSAASIVAGGYLLWLLRKATVDPLKMPRESIFGNSSNNLGKNASSEGYSRFDDKAMDKNEPSGAINPAFNVQPELEQNRATQLENLPEAGVSNGGNLTDPTPVSPQPTNTNEIQPSTSSEAQPKKSNMKVPKEDIPDYEEAPQVATTPIEPETRARKQSRVLFAPADEVISIEKEGADKNEYETVGSQSDEEEDERL